jgi:hypothetical protein
MMQEVNFDTRHDFGSGDDNLDEPGVPSATGGHDEFSYIPGAGDVSLPFIRLAQGLTPEVAAGTAKPGQWILPDGQLAETVTAVIMGMRKTRMLRDNNEIVCRSMDGLVGVGNPGGSCEACPFAEWAGTKEKRTPPACTLAYQYLSEYSGEDGSGVGVISMSTRSASKVAAQVNLYIRMNGLRNTRVTLGSTLVVKGSRKFHAPTLIKAEMVRARLAPPKDAETVEVEQPANE